MQQRVSSNACFEEIGTQEYGDTGRGFNPLPFHQAKKLLHLSWALANCEALESKCSGGGAFDFKDLTQAGWGWESTCRNYDLIQKLQLIWDGPKAEA
ncbi:MAG: hypothetical protein P4L40_11875 [Terracidiphilus sp.]|nr:hypothetical protein [Terracidiphilus sp.]